MPKGTMNDDEKRIFMKTLCLELVIFHVAMMQSIDTSNFLMEIWDKACYKLQADGQGHLLAQSMLGIYFYPIDAISSWIRNVTQEHKDWRSNNFLREATTLGLYVEREEGQVKEGKVVWCCFAPPKSVLWKQDIASSVELALACTLVSTVVHILGLPHEALPPTVQNATRGGCKGGV